MQKGLLDKIYNKQLYIDEKIKKIEMIENQTHDDYLYCTGLQGLLEDYAEMRTLVVKLQEVLKNDIEVMKNKDVIIDDNMETNKNL